jgi:hypothetical protein
MEEVSAKTQMARIRIFERGFIATHLVNIGAKVGIFEVLNEEKRDSPFQTWRQNSASTNPT